MLIEKAVSGSRRLELGKVRDCPRKALDAAEGIVAGKRKPRLHGGCAFASPVAQDETGDDRHRAHCAGQLVVGIRNAGKQLACLLGGEAVLRQQRQQHARRGAVRLGEVDVEPDNRRAGLAQIVDQLGDDAARPGPLSDLLQARIVDVDDADRQIAGLARRRPLIQVEAYQRSPVENAGGGDPRRNRQHQDRKGQEIQPAPAKKSEYVHCCAIFVERQFQLGRFQFNCMCCCSG